MQASVKEGYPSKKVVILLILPRHYFTNIASSNVETVAGRHSRPAYDNTH